MKTRPFIIGPVGGLILGGFSPHLSLTLIAAFLVFGGSTYLLFFLRVLNLPYLLLVLIGLFSFVVGIILLTKLIEEKEPKPFS